MCGIAGAVYRHPPTEADVRHVATMSAALEHRGPDDSRLQRFGRTVLASRRLAIVDVANGRQPFSNERGSIKVIYNGEIYNHETLRNHLVAAGHKLATHSDGEVIAHLYEMYGDDFVEHLDGQFAIALVDLESDRLILVRDRFGICPLHWVDTNDALYFCSEIKGLLDAGVAPRKAEPRALVQLCYFGTVCAPLTAFKTVRALPPAHRMCVTAGRPQTPISYWTLEYPRAADQPHIVLDDAVSTIQEHLVRVAASHVQGEFAPACLLSGGIDSALVAALLAQHQRGRLVQAFCAKSDQRGFDESADAEETAKVLGVGFNVSRFSDNRIAGLFPRLVRHAEVPAISTESAALMQLAENIRAHSKVVLTGEGADEAFGGYLAFRQYKALGWLGGRGMSGLRAFTRPLLKYHYGTDCLLPSEQRLAALRSQFGFIPAQAYEWEFYRAAMLPVLAPDFAQQLAHDKQWQDFELSRDATRGRHWLNQSLFIAQQVMLPNYLLGPHGDRIFQANSIEGRYPFLDRRLFEYAAQLPPSLKLKGSQDKVVLRAAAKRWLPERISARNKRRFVMPFGTPFLGTGAPDVYRYLLDKNTLQRFGYFDSSAVARVLEQLASLPPRRSGARDYLKRLALGIATTCVTSTQLWHHLFMEVPGGGRKCSAFDSPSLDEALA